MVAILAVYLFAIEIISMETAHRRFLVLQDTNGELQFKTTCLSTDLCHRGRLEISVVGSNPDMLTTNVRDVIIGFKDELLQKTLYIRADSQHNHISTTSNQGNATVFRMDAKKSGQQYQITFLDTTANKTMIPLAPHNDEGKECAVGDLKLVDMNDSGLTQHQKHKFTKAKFVLYDHVHRKHFVNSPECC